MVAAPAMFGDKLSSAGWFGVALGVLWRKAQRELCLTNEDLCRLVNAVAVQRDRGAFAELFRHFVPRLKGFALKQGADAAAAEELAQETMLAVWRKADTFDAGRATVSTWMFTILRNKRIDLFRRENRPESDLVEAADAPSDSNGPDKTFQAAESGDALRQALMELPEEQRNILQKAFFEDKSHSAIANELRLPLGTVKSRIRLALARLRAALPEEHP